MQRREFVILFGGAAAASPILRPRATRAQQVLPVIGFLNGGSAWELGYVVAAFHQGLKDTGYVEGRNVLVDYRWAEGHYDRLPTMATELVRRRVAVIAANGPAALPAKSATDTIPIVFRVGVDPVQTGLVASLNRPGGNLTGVSALNAELGPKRLELLREIVPTAATIAVLMNPASVGFETSSRDFQAAARTLGLQIHVLLATYERDIEAAFATLAQLRIAALVIGNDVFFTSRSEQLAVLALRHAVPTIYQFREFVAAGGLMSYGGSVTDQYRLFGVYVGRILKGEKPSDLPVQQATRIELIINMKAAKALGITFPLTLLGRADEVIE